MRFRMTLAATACLAVAPVPASVFYVDTKGKDTQPGTLASPFASLKKAHDAVAPGDTVFIRGGTYAISGAGAGPASGITLSKSGLSEAKRICFWAYQNEVPVFDFTGWEVSATTAGSGLTITGSWLHIKGLEIRNVPEPGTPSNNGVLVVGAGNDILETMNSHHNPGTGFFVSGGTGGHLLLNCDAHHNYDPLSNKGAGQNADGFGVHYQKTGLPTTLRGCRAWWNSDDGFDCINQDQPVVVEKCWNWLHGYVPGTMTSAASGNGNGFKIGGYGMPPTKYPDKIPQHTVRNCLAFLNKAAGFYQNHQLGPSVFYNNTSFNNRSSNFNMLGYDLQSAGDAGMGIWKNNLAFTGTAISNAAGADAAFNSWNLAGLTVSAADFESTDTAGVAGPRKADGSLPDVKFMRLKAGSDLIDKGTGVGGLFAGTAPDLGAFEFGAVIGLKDDLGPAASRKRGIRGALEGAGMRYFDPSGRILTWKRASANFPRYLVY